MTIIERRVYLETKYLDSDIMTHLYKKICSLTTGECTKDYGYILVVNKIIKIINNEDTIFTLLFDADTLKPETGSKLSGNVCMIFKDGIFVNISNRQKVLIPSVTLKDYSYDEISVKYINDNRTIKEGDIIDVLITGCKFNKKGFICIGSLI